MFVKTQGDLWINLSTCRQIEVEQCQIVLRAAIVGNDVQSVFFIGPFETEGEARKILDSLLCTYKEGQRVWCPESAS